LLKNTYNHRQNVVVLTDIRKEKVKALEQKSDELSVKILSMLSDDEQINLLNYVEKIIAGIKKGEII
jgi:DNA-binding MarR family transcriptional regulator